MNVCGARPTPALAVFTAFLVACAAGMSNAAPQTDPPAKPAESSASSPNLATGRVTFDDTAPALIEVKRAPTGHLLVRPIVNGRPPAWFILDTGAGICCISTPHADDFNLTAAGSIDAQGVGGAASKPLFRASTLTLGPVTLHDEPIMTTDFSFLKRHLGEEIVGVVGFGLFSACIVELNIAEPRVALHNPSTYALASGSWVPLTLEGRIPSVRARFEDHEGLFRLDTGANGFVTFHQPAVVKWKLLEGREANGPVSDAKLGGVGGFVAAKTGTIAWFELGGLRRENIKAEFATEAKGNFADAVKDGNIGADMLKPFTLVLDYPHERIAFLPNADETEKAEPATASTPASK